MCSSFRTIEIHTENNFFPKGFQKKSFFFNLKSVRLKEASREVAHQTVHIKFFSLRVMINSSTLGNKTNHQITRNCCVDV